MTSQKNADRKKSRWIFKKLKRFHQEEDGVTMLEFALVALPFIYILGSIFEFALRFFAQTLMDHGSVDIARMVRTNQITLQNYSKQTFKEELCNHTVMKIFDCGKLVVDLQQIDSFRNPGVPRDSEGRLDDGGMGFQPGGAHSINVLRVYYDWPTFMPWQQPLSANPTPTGHLLVNTQAFVIEP